MLTIYTVYKEPDCDTDYYQFESDARRAAMDYLAEIATDEGWGIEELLECLKELTDTGKCEGVVYLGTLDVR